MITLMLHGSLGCKFGNAYTVNAPTVRAAARLLATQMPDFRDEVLSGYYRIIAEKGKSSVELGEDSLDLLGVSTFHIVPVPCGAGGDNNGLYSALKVVAGIALIGFGVSAMPAIVASGTGAGTASAAFATETALFGMSAGRVILTGVSLLLGGIANLLAPSQKLSSPAESRDSFLFNGPANAIEQGSGVPVVYGKVMTGSTTIAASLQAEQI